MRPVAFPFQCAARAGMQRASLRDVLLVPFAALLFLLTSVTAEAQTEVPVVRLQLHWTHQAQFAGYYVAKELGFYKREGIDVELTPGGVNADSMTVLGRDATDVAIAWITSAIAARQSGYDVVNIAQIFKFSAMRLVCWRAAGINQPGDIKGKTIGVWRVGDEYNVTNWLQHMLGSDTDVKVVQQRADAADFLNRSVDCATAMTYNEYATIIRAGVPLSDIFVVSFADDHFGFLEDGLYVRASSIENASKRDLLTRFLRASAEGWRHANINRDEAVTITRRYAPQSDAARQRAMLDEVLLLVQPEDRFGWLDLDDFERSVRSISQGAADNAARITDEVVRGAWTHRIWDAAGLQGTRR